MFSEMINLYERFSDATKDGKLNLMNRPLRSISTLSSSSIFYFPLIISDQCSLEEIKLIGRALEKQYAAFVAACISLMPFYRVPSEGEISIENYLRVFHQNIGISRVADITGIISDIQESVTVTDRDIEIAKRDFEKLWNESLVTNETVIERVLTKVKSINENGPVKEYLDPLSKVILHRFNKALN
jgi:hypothetical protein